MTDSESDGSVELNESMTLIHSFIEKLSHDSKHIYAKALKVHTLLEHPDLDLWSQEFQLHERAHAWAKHHVVARKCSLWQVHQTLLESAKRDKRISRGHIVRLLKEEADIMDLPTNHPISVWLVLSKLPRFFL
jgi:hypothetical protein